MKPWQKGSLVLLRPGHFLICDKLTLKESLFVMNISCEVYEFAAAMALAID